jgi:hypothetical protein
MRWTQTTAGKRKMQRASAKSWKTRRANLLRQELKEPAPQRAANFGLNARANEAKRVKSALTPITSHPTTHPRVDRNPVRAPWTVEPKAKAPWQSSPEARKRTADAMKRWWKNRKKQTPITRDQSGRVDVTVISEHNSPVDAVFVDLINQQTARIDTAQTLIAAAEEEIRLLSRVRDLAKRDLAKAPANGNGKK